MLYQLTQNPPTPDPPIILDSIIHRVIWLDTELSNESGYSVKINCNGGSHTLQIGKGGNPNYKSTKCDNVQTPPYLHVPIRQIGSSSQNFTPLNYTLQRIIEMGVDVGTDGTCHITFVTDVNGPTVADYLLIGNPSSMEKIGLGGEGWKVPPTTGFIN